MAGRIRDEDIALVRERAPIADVVGEYLNLRNAGGGSLKGLCPFHDEKSPSFNVTPSRGLWHCFGCQEGGDVFTFLQKIDQLSFVEAVETLAQRVGVQLRYTEGGYVPRNEHSRRQRLLEAHREAAEFFAGMMSDPRAEAARTLLRERGFSGEQYRGFGVGYAPPGWENLTRHLRGKGFTDEELVLGGLASQGRRGPYDKFRNRLLWPVREVGGEVVGFGARKLDDTEDGPKYLNTPETPIFKKSRLLYGIDLAKREIGRGGQAVIVEGYTDVMACHLAGISTAVATCGTSFGADHVKVLRRLLESGSGRGGSVVFGFDGDAAGQRAALRAFESAQGEFTHLYVAVQPDGLDPCDLRVQRGDAAVRAMVDSRRQLSDFVIQSRIGEYDLDTSEGQLAAIDAAAPVITGIRDSGQRELTTRNLARWVGVAEVGFVARRVRQHGAGESGARPAPPPRQPRASGDYDLRDPSIQRERLVLKLALQQPGLAGGFDAFEAEAFTAPQHRAIHRLIRDQGGVAAASDPAKWAALLRDSAPNDTQRDFVTELAVERIEVDGELDAHWAADILNAVRIHAINRRLTELNSQLSRLDPVSQAREVEEVSRGIVALQQRKRALREGSAASG